MHPHVKAWLAHNKLEVIVNTINRAVKQYQQNAPTAQPKLMADCISHLAGHLPDGITLQIDSTGVSASLGTERFTLHPNRYELQTDIEALCRLAARRLQ